jgi:hypothetical protein
LLQIFPFKNPSKIMIITSHMQKGSYMEIFEARVLGENLSFWLKNPQF